MCKCNWIFYQINKLNVRVFVEKKILRANDDDEDESMNCILLWSSIWNVCGFGIVSNVQCDAQLGVWAAFYNDNRWKVMLYQLTDSQTSLRLFKSLDSNFREIFRGLFLFDNFIYMVYLCKKQRDIYEIKNSSKKANEKNYKSVVKMWMWNFKELTKNPYIKRKKQKEFRELIADDWYD